MNQIGWKDSKISSLLEMSERLKTGKLRALCCMRSMGRKSHTNVAASPSTATNDARNFDEVKFFSKSVLYLQQLEWCKFSNDDLKILGF